MTRSVLLSSSWLIALAAPLVGQRVQFPTSDPYAVTQPPPATSPPTSTFAAPAPSYGSPPATVTAPPTYTPPAASAPYPTTASPGAPPLFDPYASSGTPLGPPPASVPYNYTSPGSSPPPTVTGPPPAATYPAPTTPLYPDGLPFQWQPDEEGYWVKAQRFLQELSLEYTYLYGDHNEPDELGIHRGELTSTFAIPVLYNIDSPLLVSPGFAANWLEGPMTPPPAGMMPTGPDLPPRVYDAYLDLAWYPRWGEWLGGELGFRTGVWSDFDHIDSDAVRFLGRGLASIALTPNLDILFGAVYLDRLDVKLLPAGGVYWRPTPDWDAYIVFPNPKVRKRFVAVGNSLWFWYFAGEYGGGSWSVQRQVNSDRIDINDLRVSGGFEWETQTKIRGYIEVGYVFDREVLFASGMPATTFKPNDTVMIRSGIDF